MNDTLIYDLNATKIINSFDSECVHAYVGVILGVLLFLSEALPFIQEKSKCTEEQTAVIDVEYDEGQIKETEKPTTLLQKGNGLLHLCASFYFKTRK